MKRISQWLSAAMVVGFALHQPVQAQTIQIGAPLPLTGALAPEGLKQKQGYELWGDEANKAGGVQVGNKKMKIEFVYYDYQSSTPKAVQLTEKLITEDKVNFILAPFGSGATKATSNVTEKYNVVDVSPTASSEQVYDQGFKYLFGILNSNAIVSKALLGYLKTAAPSVQKVAIYSRNDLFPLAIATSLDGTAKANSYPVVFFEKYPLNATDHSAALTELRSKNADWIYVSGYTDDLIRIRKQMVDLKVTAPVVTMLAGPAYPDFVDALGDMANGVTSVTWWHPDLQFKSKDVFGSTANYVKLFTERYKKSPDYTEAASSAAGVVLQMAIEKAGTIDSQRVRDELASDDFATFYGSVKFGPNGQNAAIGDPIFQIQDKKIVIISPADAKQGDLQLMK
jgi:branched-chain amino acid transport system substrate-binding protein